MLPAASSPVGRAPFRLSEWLPAAWVCGGSGASGVQDGGEGFCEFVGGYIRPVVVAVEV